MRRSTGDARASKDSCASVWTAAKDELLNFNTRVCVPDDPPPLPLSSPRFGGQCHDNNNYYARLRESTTIIASRRTYDWTRIKVRHPGNTSINRSPIVELYEASRPPSLSLSQQSANMKCFAVSKSGNTSLFRDNRAELTAAWRKSIVGKFSIAQ